MKNLGQYIIRAPSYPRASNLSCVMLDTRLDSLVTFSGSLNFQMHACENRRKNKLLKITGDFLSFFFFFFLFVYLHQRALTKYIYSKFCDPCTFMTKYKLVIVPSKCETVTEKPKSGVLLYSCFCLEFTAQSVKAKKAWTNSLSDSGDKFTVWLEKDCCSIGLSYCHP